MAETKLEQKRSPNGGDSPLRECHRLHNRSTDGDRLAAYPLSVEKRIWSRIGWLPIRYLLKNEFGLGPQATATFFAVTALAWYFKPLAGILSDSFPLFGTRRRHYLLLSLIVSGLLWLLLGNVTSDYNRLLGVTLILNACLVVASSVIGGVLVEKGQLLGVTGLLSALLYFTRNLTNLASGPLTGYFASLPIQYTVLTAATILLAVVPCIYLLFEESPLPSEHKVSIAMAWCRFKRLICHRPSWVAVVMVFLVYISPGFATPLWYYQSDTLGFSPQFIGNLGAVSSCSGMLGSALYASLSKRLSLRTLLAVGIATNATSTLAYLFYTSSTAAIFIEAAAAFTSVMATVAILDFAARATPVGSEAIGFSLLMSVMNITVNSSDMFGSWLFESLHTPLGGLIWLNALTTAAVCVVVPFLPAALVR